MVFKLIVDLEDLSSCEVLTIQYLYKIVHICHFLFPFPANEDFIPTRSVVCFRDNSHTSENFTVPILGASDSIPEFNEVFSVVVDLGPEFYPDFFNLPDRPATVIIVDSELPY